MPFVTSMPLEDMVDEHAAPRACRRIADAFADRLVENTRRNTPVDTSPFRDKPGRPRGTARASVQRTGVELRGRDRYEIRAFSDDPVFPFIEWTTKPHWIRPRQERGPGARLRFPNPKTGDPIFARAVHHPGTQGQHSFAIGALLTEAELGEIAAPIMMRFGRDLVSR
jgi:hypothetical protein